MKSLHVIELDKSVYFDRSQAQDLAKKIRRNKSKEIVIDFSQVVFISRAFADEWLNQLEKLAIRKTITVRHIKSDPRKMIQLVKKKKQQIRKQFSR